MGKNGSTIIPQRRKNHGDHLGHASQSTAKLEYSWKIIMLCKWWDQLCVMYYKLPKPNETITKLCIKHN
ncbi:hypothetical protein X975_08479, partial [Stegodyphus mimosarum]